MITSMDVTSDRSGRWTGILDPCYAYLDYFLPSIEQAAPISGRQEPRDIADFFLKQGVKNVAIKLGSRGLTSKTKMRHFMPEHTSACTSWRLPGLEMLSVPDS